MFCIVGKELRIFANPTTQNMCCFVLLKTQFATRFVLYGLANNTLVYCWSNPTIFYYYVTILNKWSVRLIKIDEIFGDTSAIGQKVSGRYPPTIQHNATRNSPPAAILANPTIQNMYCRVDIHNKTNVLLKCPPYMFCIVDLSTLHHFCFVWLCIVEHPWSYLFPFELIDMANRQWRFCSFPN